MAGDRQKVLANLRARIARLEQSERADAGLKSRHLPFGVAAVDSRLPGGGLRLGNVHEVAPIGSELVHSAACTLFTAGILARLHGPVLWCLAARGLFAPGLACAGLRPDRVLFAETFREAELMPLVEEGARFAGLAGVVGEVAKIGLTATRRLQLAAESSGVTVFLLRRSPWGRESSDASAAATRWRVSAHPSAPLATLGLGRSRWLVELVRCRGAPAGTQACDWILDACDEAGRLALPADLADRPSAQARPLRAAAR